ncbi:hypothetical protein INT47_012463 [Mucor saturninus]|uniref:DDE Tnp4 domain-containing protein n=1 Tax=Mucor saturninus TaxID=64648 RepID=A0A8H7QFU3_9FUNG|nr:hypothetical protein INT47_012463 [Mucor saturninus]
MPKQSTRKQTLNEMKSLLKHIVIIENKEEAEDMHELLSGLETKRVLNSGSGIPKLDQYREYFLEWNDEEFIKICRMNKDSFLKLLRLIEDHAVFNNYSFIPQRDVHVQLAVTLRRLSHDGTGNSIEQIATLFGISKGSVTDYTNRCFKAITDNLQHLMSWHNKKGFYSVNCQVVCDERKIILGFQSGQAGSMCDATCVEHASFMINREAKYFTCGDGASHEYLLGDSGYALHPFVLNPYRRPQVVHSSARVAVENTIGVLKGKWRILKNIPIQINCEEDIMRIHELVHVCGLLHNYLILENDNFEGDFYEDVDVGQSRLDVVLLESFDNVNIVSSRILNAWRDSVADVVLADYAVHFGYDNE